MVPRYRAGVPVMGSNYLSEGALTPSASLRHAIGGAFPHSIVLARRHDGDGTQFHELRIRIGTRPEKSKWKSSSPTPLSLRIAPDRVANSRQVLCMHVSRDTRLGLDRIAHCLCAVSRALKARYGVELGDIEIRRP